MFSISSTNALTAVAARRTPSGDFRAHWRSARTGRCSLTADCQSDTVSMLAITPPTAAISAPADGQTYDFGQSVATSFACEDVATGVRSCTDSNGGSGTAGSLATSAVGSHAYTATVLSNGGLSANATINYAVRALPVPPPPSSVTGPP